MELLVFLPGKLCIWALGLVASLLQSLLYLHLEPRQLIIDVILLLLKSGIITLVSPHLTE